jgi:hypothetical protein
MFISGAYHMKINQVQYLPNLRSKNYKIASKKSQSSRAFEYYKEVTSISLKINFDFVELSLKKLNNSLHCNSKHHETTLVYFYSSKAFQRYCNKKENNSLNNNKKKT